MKLQNKKDTQKIMDFSEKYCKGKDQKKFYKDLIAESEAIIEKHEKELENERRNQNDGK